MLPLHEAARQSQVEQRSCICDRVVVESVTIKLGPFALLEESEQQNATRIVADENLEVL